MKSVVVTLVAITLFACGDNYKNVQQLRQTDGAPSGEGKNIRLVYTDSGRVVTTLDAPRLLSYDNFHFGYQEFPEGVLVKFYEDGAESTVTSDYAVKFNNTDIVDLRENVVLNTADGNVLNAQQLYWDQKNQWVFTDQPYRITFNDGSYNDGERFDANQDFTVFLSRKNDGIQIVDQKKDLNGN